MTTKHSPEAVPNGLYDFIDRLIEEKGFGPLETDVREQIRRDLASRLEDYINAAILQALPPEQLEGLEKLLDKNPGKVREFCVEHIENLDEVMAEAFVNFRSVYLG